LASDATTSRGADTHTLPLTLLALVAFAGNSLLTRLAFTGTTIDPVSFTSIRLAAGAIVLAVMFHGPGGAHRFGGTWASAAALFVYAAAFSFAYVRLTTGTGALLLFGAVQATMITLGVARGERLSLVQGGGLLLAYGGLVALVRPGLAAPPSGTSRCAESAPPSLPRCS